MFNTISLVFVRGEKIPESGIEPNTISLQFMPPPNRLSRNSEIFDFTQKVIAYSSNINPEHELIQQFSKELQEDFQISLEFQKNYNAQGEMPALILEPFQEDEGYSLSIRHDRIIFQAATNHGLFNAFQTFRQVVIQAPNKALPGLEILDWPALKMRGMADDVSRGQIPTVESAKRFIKDLSRYKNNYYGLYIEDVFQCSSHPRIGEKRGAFTPEELREIDSYAKSRFITLFPILETLGHMDNILMLPDYRDLGEFPGAQSLALSNGNIYPFLRDILSELIPCFSSKIVHIGCDETFDLGHGASAEIIKTVGMAQALLDHFRKVIKIAKDNGAEQIIIYHDVIMKFPQIAEALSSLADVVIMYWEYSPKKHYPTIDRFLDANRRVIVSPSMLCWGRHFPDYQTAAKNILKIIEDLKSTARIRLDTNLVVGELNSTWGDFSNHNLRENNIYGAIISAAAAWSIEPVNYDQIIEAIGRTFFGISEPSKAIQFKNLFKGINDLIRFYKKPAPMIPHPFYTYLYRHPFRDPGVKPLIKQYKIMQTEAQELLLLYDEISKCSKQNAHYLQDQ